MEGNNERFGQWETGHTQPPSSSQPLDLKSQMQRKIELKKAELRRKMLEKVASQVQVPQPIVQQQPEFSIQKPVVDFSKYEEDENEAQPNDEYVDACVDGKLPSLQPLDAHDTQDDIEKCQELQSNKKKFLEERLKINDLYGDDSDKRCEYFEEKLPKATRECLDKDLEKNFKKMVEYVENNKYKANFAIWPELVPNKINRKVEYGFDLTNPGYMKRTVDFYKIDEIGSNYPKETFDPHTFFEDDCMPKVEVRQDNTLGSIIPSSLYGINPLVANSSIPVFHNPAALTGNNTYDDPKFLQFIAQREKEAKMSNSLREEF